MFRFAILSILAPLAPLALAANLSISPDPVYDCSNGAGVATLSWSGASGPVDIRVGDAKGTSLTGLTGASGSAVTGRGCAMAWAFLW